MFNRARICNFICNFKLKHNLFSPLFSRYMGFPCGSDGKESTCNAGDLGSIPGLGRSPGEGIGYPLQYSWASLATQWVKNPPAMRETWVQLLGWEDLEKGKATHSSVLAWRISRTVQSMGSQSRTRLSDFHFHIPCVIYFLTLMGKLLSQNYKTGLKVKVKSLSRV